MKCEKCGNENQPEAVFCDQCGSRLSGAAAPSAPAANAAPLTVAAMSPASPAGVCPQCGASNTPGEMFCDECGAPLDAPAPDAAVSEPAASEPAASMSAVTMTAARSSGAAGDLARETPTPTAPAATEAQANVCQKCGAPGEPGDAFCAKCGAELTTPSLATPSSDAKSTPETASEPAAATEGAAAPQKDQFAATQSPTPAAPQPLTECPSCGAGITEGDVFCDFCGAALVGDAAATPASSETPATSATPVTVIAPQPATRVASPMPASTVAGPHLVVLASGATLPLPETGEAQVGRADPLSNAFPEVDLTPHGGEEGGVSRRHFQITLGEGQYAIQDLNSTNATWLNRQRLQPGLPVALNDGDEIRAGRVALQFRAG